MALEASLESGAEDFSSEDGVLVVTTDPNALQTVQDTLITRGLSIESAEIAMLPQSTVSVSGSEAQSLLKLIEALEELDDVSKVSSNFDIDAATLAEA
jgi:transcriptional/translational regulatory protein YebC/TACO1